MNEIRLNLGCGKDIREGWLSYDMFPVDSRVKKLDLNKIPLPFDNDSVDYILMASIFEHLDVNRYEFMREIHRILKPGGIVEINVPASHRSIMHTMWFFPINYFDNICLDFSKSHPSYTDFRFEMLEKKRIGGDKYKIFFDLFPWLDKLFPFMCSFRLRWKLRKPVPVDEKCSRCNGVAVKDCLCIDCLMGL